MEKPRRYFPLENRFNVEIPEWDPDIGPWHCVCDAEGDEYHDIFEVHDSYHGDKIVFRISMFSNGQIRLGKCVILNKKDAIRVRDRLTALIGTLTEDDDEKEEE